MRKVQLDKTAKKAAIAQINAVITKIGHQFPNTDFGRFALAIVEIAIKDAVGIVHGEGAKNRILAIQSARNFLSGDMLWCELAGVNSEWVRRVLEKSKVLEVQL